MLSFKEVFDADRTATIWDSFSEMDCPRKTFSFIDEVTSSPNYNSRLPFTTVPEAKRLLKVQIADFVGSRLTDSISPIRNELQELLAELKTLRHSEIRDPAPAEQSRKVLITMRFLLDDNIQTIGNL